MRMLCLVLISLLVSGCGQKDLENLGFSDSKGVGDKSNLKWSENMIPVKIKFPKAVESKIYLSAYNAIEEWNTKAGRPLLYFEFVDAPLAVTDESYDGTNRFYNQVDWESTGYPSSILGITKYRYLNGALIEADIILNDTRALHYTNLADDTITNSEYDVQSILLHEIGHFLGFDHVEEADSAMETTLSSGRFERTLSTKDISRLKAKY